MKKQMMWKTKGMNQDLSVSAFNPEFSFENMNLRLSTNEGNTQMSWVNEKGTKLIHFTRIEAWDGTDITDEGIWNTPIGTAIINHKLVLFTNSSDNVTSIYVVEFANNAKTEMKGKLLYRGTIGLDNNYPLETLASYEAEHIQKVYWTDGLNQPRMINIAASINKIEKWNTYIEFCPFDFVPAFAMNEKVEITNHVGGGGLFAPGVIQYAFTYINKYGQQSNLVYVSPLYYLAHSNRGASPEEKVTNSFEIMITDIDQHFDYVRLYSIQRTSLDAVPFVKHLDDLPISGNTAPEQFSRTLVYSSDSSINLPKDNNGKILTARVTNGSYSVSVTPYTSEAAFANNKPIMIVADYGDGSHEEDIMSLQDLVDALQAPVDFSDGESDVYFNNDYHSGFEVTQGLDRRLQELAEELLEPHVKWAVRIDSNTLLTGNETRSFYQMKFIYNYKDQKWYITKDPVTESVIQNPPTASGTILYTDNGTTGATMDPTELLYVGGKEITALTMTEKDQTLFLGNIEQKNSLVTSIQKYFYDHRNEISVEFTNEESRKVISGKRPSGIYTHTQQLDKSRRKITSFKGGEIYRFGFQLQKNTGEWTEPIFLKDEINKLYPKMLSFSSANLVCAYCNVPTSPIDTSIYKRIRPVVVYPNIGERNVLCQGVLNPTVFNVKDRIEKAPYAQASWFFRPYMTGEGATGSAFEVPDYTVSPEQQPESPDISIPLFFINNPIYNQTVYVMVADVEATTLEIIKNRGYISATSWYVWNPDNPTQDDNPVNDFDTNYPCYFFGIIDLGSNRYAFISNRPWTEEYNKHRDTIYNQGTGVTTGSAFYYNDNIQNSKVESRGFTLCSMNSSSDYKMYYQKPADIAAPDKFVFKFFVGGTYYKVTFTGIEGAVTTNNTAGNDLVFAHYDSIYSQDDLAKKASYNDPEPNNNNNRRNIEIQGAVRSYDSPFDLTEDSSVSSNTQFFIDQSIITLNSPDIEFDTEVQNYGNEGLKLRVIGVIPLTANASYHKITTSSAMLEVSHNVAWNGSGEKPFHFGKGELSNNVIHNNIDSNAGKRLIADYLWNDVYVYDAADQEDKIKTGDRYNFLVHPWQRSGSLNNDYRSNNVASSVLKTKKTSHILYSANTEYLGYNSGNGGANFANIGTDICYTENAEIMTARLPKQKSTSSDINYYPNIDKVLYNDKGYIPFADASNTLSFKRVTSPISMKYKSTTHAVVALDASTDDATAAIPILPYGITSGGKSGQYTGGEGTTFWKDTQMRFSQGSINISSLNSNGYNFLWLGEIYKKGTNPFGGESKEAIRNNKWLIAGDTVDIGNESTVKLYWEDGDTYFQRYDCLKTYPFTTEDTNQLVEILSFMCETHVNIDGRYDRNRGQVDNTSMSPQNFNLLNPAYSQQDNFFISRKLDYEDVETLKYPNQLVWSKTKNSGADVDLWTNITLANSLELDGDKGEVKSLNRLNDQVICFQDSGISQILYNENTQISTTEGVPIEIANSGKVQGKRYLSNTVGCSNKWSVVNTPSGIYFIDSNEKAIYLFNGQLQNLSVAGGFNSWCKKNIPSSEVKWNPVDFNNFRSFYDKLNQEVMFVNKETALTWSEKLGTFTSFYDYGNAPYYLNFDDTGVWIHRDNEYGIEVWKHQAGAYCNFFRNDKPYWMTLVGNPEPLIDKTFTNMEFRACTDAQNPGDMNRLPFDYIETWNEYQHGFANLSQRNEHDMFKHHTSDGKAHLARKFRIWRCDIPRDNSEVNFTTESRQGIFRRAKHPLDRMRNPWLYLKLYKAKAGFRDTLNRTEIHDMVMTYFT